MSSKSFLIKKAYLLIYVLFLSQIPTCKYVPKQFAICNLSVHRLCMQGYYITILFTVHPIKQHLIYETTNQ